MKHPLYWVAPFALFAAVALAVLWFSPAPPAFAQARPNGAGSWQITPQYLTNSAQNVCNMTGNPPPCGVPVWACQGDLNAAAGTSVTVTITDNQASPIPFWSTVAALSSSAASSYKIWEAGGLSGCRYFPKGMLVNASSGTTIYFEAAGAY